MDDCRNDRGADAMIFPAQRYNKFWRQVLEAKTIFRRPARRGSTSDGRTGFEHERKRTVNGPASG
jgi:hypothetical protein